MSYRLNTHVYAVELDGDGRRTGREAMFGPADTLPDWAVAAISNPDVWDGDKPPAPEPPAAADKPANAAGEIARLQARISELQAAQNAAPVDAGQPTAPPRRGVGSGATEWRDYARGLGVTVADDASRDEVIAALDEAGHPTK